MNLGRPLAAWARRCLLAPGRWNHRFVWLTALISVLAASRPGFVFVLAGLAVCAWLMLAAFWCVRLFLAAVVLIRYRQSLASNRRAAVAWALPPVVGMLTLGLIVLHVPLRVCFWVPLPAMTRLAAVACDSPEALPRYGWVGLFYADRIERLDNGVRFTVRGGGILDRTGFAFVRAGVPPNLRGEDYYIPFHAGWFVWTESW
ncbi:MAG: hypothetical protein CHACPFDD_01440 [Phycisphaerae bacterium]|nr:hypothetical protein [Phycisphaerae bacterium]